MNHQYQDLTEINEVNNDNTKITISNFENSSSLDNATSAQSNMSNYSRVIRGRRNRRELRRKTNALYPFAETPLPIPINIYFLLHGLIAEELLTYVTGFIRKFNIRQHLILQQSLRKRYHAKYMSSQHTINTPYDNVYTMTLCSKNLIKTPPGKVFSPYWWIKVKDFSLRI
ncbi:hypothetical protein RhiirA1_539732 [Rhizophagus irregularis]|uniref:Uncharacterized protein n=1 Tax=Rhizophagus irregularis TaxID=588596 RepID=A0A2N0RBC0_9GLOM|nr:hypothetical protein RhiirA1_539732 [Rhizophagus irregularis]